MDRAELYALLHTGNPGDLEHYARVCAGAETVLELGSGAGRVTYELARQGHAVTGLELDRELLALAKRRASHWPADARERVRWEEGDMRRLALGRRFDRVVLPYNGLYCLGGAEAALACFRGVAEHLSADGTFWLDVYAADAFHDDAPEDDMTEDEPSDQDDEPVATLRADGGELVVYEESRWLRPLQKLEVTYRFLREGREVARQSLEHHYLLTSEIVLLLEEAGLEVIEASGGFTGEPPGDDADLLVLGARHA